jgi:TolB-like protein/Tfp pilus assembly protein PilF
MWAIDPLLTFGVGDLADPSLLASWCGFTSRRSPMPDIFLSYTREDQATAQRFAEAFEAQGFSVWWDATLRSGEAYDQVTEEALHDAKAVVVLWSPRSVGSRWVRAEATVADQNKTLMPVMIEACRRPVMFELTQTADLSRWTGEAADPAWCAFLADVRRFVEAGGPQQPVQPRPAAVAPKPVRRSARPSVAVLPFINRSGRSEDDVFADGMVEDLTAALAVSPWMKVLAASATAAYRTGARDVRQVGRDLGIRYLLEGNVRRVGEDLRTTAQLIEAETGDIRWTQKFDRPLRELAAFQEDLVAEIAAHIGVQVRRIETEQALNNPGNISGWEAYVRSMSFGSCPTRSNYETAVDEASKVVEMDPNDGPAYAILASVQGQLLHHSGGDDPRLAREIVENIRRARALDPDNPTVLAGIGAALIGLQRLQEAQAVAARAVALAPNDDVGRHMFGAVLARLGRSDEAIAELEAGDRLAPNGTWAYLSSLNRSIAHLQAGRLDQALEAADRTANVLPGPELLIQSILSAAKLDRWDRALEAMRSMRETDPEISRALAEKLVRGLYCGASAAQVEDYAGVIRRAWDEASGEAGSP